MTRYLIAALVALSIIGGIASSASAHRPKPQQTAAEKPFSGQDFWDQQQKQ